MDRNGREDRMKNTSDSCYKPESGDWRGSGLESLMTDLVVCVGLTSIPQPVLHNRLPKMRNGLVP